MAYLSLRNATLNTSSINVSSLTMTNGQFSTLLGSTFTDRAVNSSTLVTSTLNTTSTVTGSMGVSTLTGSTITANTINVGTSISTDTSGNLYSNSGFGSAGIIYGCRAWGHVVFSSGAISTQTYGNASLSRSSAGTYVVTMTTAMPDTNYSVCLGCTNIVSGYNFAIAMENVASFTRTTNSFGIIVNGVAGSSDIITDPVRLSFQVFR